MMQAPPGIFALYARHAPEGTPPREPRIRPVIAFDDDGTALVTGNGGSLVPASTLADFDRLTDGGDGPEFTALIPSGGWRIEFTWQDDTTYSEPIVAWALTQAGQVTALYVDGDNAVMGTDDLSGKFRIYHPDSDPLPDAEPGTPKTGRFNGN